MSPPSENQNGPVDFEQNGNFIPLDSQSLLKYVYTLLNDYDIKKSKGIDLTNYTNPYKDKIVMPLGDDKYVGIPEELHTYAIEKWIKTGVTNISKTQNKAEEVEIKHVYNVKKNEDNCDINDDCIITHASDCGCKGCSVKKESSNFTYYSKIFVCILAIIILIYVANTFGSKLCR